MTNTEWYLEMAKLIKKRDHAEKMITRWQVAVANAEEEIQKLSHRLQDSINVPEQISEPEQGA